MFHVIWGTFGLFLVDTKFKFNLTACVFSSNPICERIRPHISEFIKIFIKTNAYTYRLCHTRFGPAFLTMGIAYGRLVTVASQDVNSIKKFWRLAPWVIYERKGIRGDVLEQQQKKFSCLPFGKFFSAANWPAGTFFFSLAQVHLQDLHWSWAMLLGSYIRVCHNTCYRFIPCATKRGNPCSQLICRPSEY